jgi:hypothetical protein
MKNHWEQMMKVLGIVSNLMGTYSEPDGTKILDEVHQSNSVPWTPDGTLLEENHSFHSPGGAMEQCNKQSQIVFNDFRLFLIGYIV